MADPDGQTLGVVVRPELGRARHFHQRAAGPQIQHEADGLVVVASSCMLADSAAAATHIILRKSRLHGPGARLPTAVPGVHGGVVLQGRESGVAGGLELAA